VPERPIQGSISFGGNAAAKGLGEQLRQAMSYWPTGVAALAVSHRGRIEAITLSLDPPLVLASIGRHAPIVPALDDAARFTIGMLAGDQARAASSIADRLPSVPALFNDDAGDPILADCIATIVCTTSQIHPAGDHKLYIGAVERVLLGREAPPLLYHQRRYRRIE
jgi:flavin reductase (DIM6/NTAB) family NADH-FMN oxidoreductase RutF